MSRRTIPALVVLVVVGLTLPLLMSGGCKKDATAEKGDVLAKLAKADALDGTTDKIVAKCSGCALRMDGSNEHVTALSGYKLNFCTAKCKKEFSKDTIKSVLAMTIPKVAIPKK